MWILLGCFQVLGSFDIGEVSREEEERALERALRGPAFHLWASIELIGVQLCDNDGFWSRDVSDGGKCVSRASKHRRSGKIRGKDV